jgi:putative sigma-54 modulation protein
MNKYILFLNIMKRYSSSRDDREEKMQVELRIRNTDLSTVLRNYAERRLRFALSRFGDRAGRVLVTVSGLDSADQGIATNCDISAEVRPFGQVTARETSRDLYAAIDRAAGRLGRLFASRLDRVEDEGQRPGLTADHTTRRNKKKISGKEPRRLLRYHPLEGRFGKNRVKQQKQAESIGAEESNKRRQ